MTGLATPRAEPQAAPAVLVVRPSAFARNAETAATNYFQGADAAGPETAAAARSEFDALAAALAAAGVRVHAFAGRAQRDAPDEVFPNNWLSLHADGTAVLYPLLAPSRRRERRRELLDGLATAGYRIERVLDLSHYENDGKYLEGTGSVVLDRVRRTAYACLSPRTHPETLDALGRQLQYEIVSFRAVDRGARPIYHTNVLLSIAPTFAVVCADAIADTDERARVLECLRRGRELLELSFDQLHAFAGNLLALDAGGAPVIALSTTAERSLTHAQRRTLQAHGQLVPVDVGTIERFGGGSVRCMLAEVHLPRAAAPVSCP